MREALGFLTVLGGSRVPTRRALRWFPVVGAGIGGAVGGIWWVTDQAFPALLAGALAVAADLVITGALHLDGLADAADGLLPHADRDRRLQIMRTPDIGAFAVAVVGATLVLRFAALSSQRPNVLLVVGVWCSARTLVAVVPAVIPYVRERGIATAMLDGSTSRWPVIALAPAITVAVLGVGAPGAAAVATTVVAAAGVIALAHRRIGGFTGDALGAAIVLGETAGLIVAGARW